MNELEYRIRELENLTHKCKLVLDRTQKEKKKFLKELVDKNFSFEFKEKMKLTQYYNSTFKLVFKRTEYSKEQTVYFAARKARIYKRTYVYIYKCTEKELGRLRSETDDNSVIERAVNRIIDVIDDTISHSETSYLENKCLLEFKKIEKGR